MTVQPAQNQAPVPAAFQQPPTPPAPAVQTPVAPPLPPVFRVPESEALRPENQFRFQMPGDDQVHSVPLLKYLPPYLAEQLGDEVGLESMHAIFDWVSPGLWEQLRDGDQMGALFTAWAEASGIDLGESEASDS